VPIVDRDEFREFIGSQNVGDYDLQVAALAGAEYAVQQLCRRAFVVAGDTATPRTFRPTNCHLLSVDDIATDDGLVVSNDGETIDADDLQLEPLNGIDVTGLAVPYTLIRLLDGAFVVDRRRRATVTVTAKWGWQAIPDAVAEACRILGKDLWHHRDTRFGVAGWGEFGVVRIRQNPTVLSLLEGLQRRERVYGWA
jgi:hypothetical protein